MSDQGVLPPARSCLPVKVKEFIRLLSDELNSQTT
jgi:hypothetical protein